MGDFAGIHTISAEYDATGTKMSEIIRWRVRAMEAGKRRSVCYYGVSRAAAAGTTLANLVENVDKLWIKQMP